MKNWSFLILLVLSSFLGTIAFPKAGVPQLISLEGRLTNPTTGAPYTGPTTITFTIWDSLTGGNLVWQETQTITLDSNGFFHALLGSVTPLPLSLPETAYLELQVGAETLSPRQRITSSAFSLRAGTADTGRPSIRRRNSNSFTSIRPTTITTVDSTGSVGEYTSIAVGLDGLPVISYRDSTNADLKVVHCGNGLCNAGNTVTTVDSAGNVGFYSSIAVGSDGLPIISYLDGTTLDLKVVHCGNGLCNAGNILTTVDSTGSVGRNTAIAVGSDGLPVISYLDSTNADLKVAHCGNGLCSSGNTITTLDSTGFVGEHSSIAVGSDGLPVISYLDSTNADLKVVHCGNILCNAGNTVTIVDSAGDVGLTPSIAVGLDGLPVISYRDSTNADLKVVHCGNGLCNAGNTVTIVDSTGDVGFYSSIAVGSDGLPVISYLGSGLKVVHCGNGLCNAGNTVRIVDSALGVGLYSSIAVGSDGLPVVSYYDSGANFDFKVAHCGNNLCDSGNIGQYASIALGVDGLPIISHYDVTNGDLLVSVCGNIACTASNSITTVDSAGNVGFYSSIAVGSDGLPVISYYDATNGDLKVVHCGNSLCNAGNILTTVDSTGSVGQYSSITVGSDGLPVISYYDATNGDLKVVHCGNSLCNAGNTITAPDSTGSVGQYSSITVGSDGLPVVSYRDATNGDLKVVHCGNSLCNAGNTITAPDSTGNVGSDLSIAVGSDGLPVISYYDATNGDLKVAHCGNGLCSSGNTITTLDSTGFVGLFTSITIGVDSLPVIAYYDGDNGNLKVAHCGNSACTLGNTIITLDPSTGNVGWYASITVGNEGLPVVSYYDATNLSLKVVKCASELCVPFWTGR